MRQYYARRRRGGGDNPLGVGVIAVGSIYYIQEDYYFNSRYGGRAVCRTPWRVEAFVNGTCGAARHNHETGQWEDTFRSGRSDFALVRSLRDRRQVRLVSVHLLIVHHDLGLCKGPTDYPSLPDLSRYRRAGRGTAMSRSEARSSARPVCCAATLMKGISIRTVPGDGGSRTDPATPTTQEHPI